MLFGRDIYDGPWRLFDYYPAPGRCVWIIHEDGRMHFRTDYPVENLIQVNHMAQAEANGKRFGDLAMVASIPLNIYHDSGMAEAMSQGDKKFTSKWLNNGDNAAWRTRGGRI